MLFLIWYDFFASFIQIAPDLKGAVWNLSVLNPARSLFFYSNSALVYLTSINGGILEVFERYAFIVVLGLAFKSKKMRVELIILLSSLIFSLNHYVNILSEQESFMNTTFQVIDVFSFGCLLAIVYLIYRKIMASYDNTYNMGFYNICNDFRCSRNGELSICLRW